MDLKFTNSVCSSLRPVLWEANSAEQTQEIKLSDGLPDIGRVISAWGQCILRSKEWNLDQIQCSAGMMVWILYAPEDGSEPRMVNTWIPFQVRWDLPDGTPEGKMVIQCLPRFSDAYSSQKRSFCQQVSNCGPQGSSISLTWNFVRNANPGTVLDFCAQESGLYPDSVILVSTGV